MIKLFRKQVVPKVFAISYNDKKGDRFITISHGYDIEEALDKKNIRKQDMNTYIYSDLEELLNEYTDEKMMLVNLQK